MAEEHVEEFRHRGWTMVYSRTGLRSGPGVVLVHGIGMGRKVYTDLAAELGRHMSVYSVDLPGFGDSPEPSAAADIATTGDLIAEFIRWAPLKNPVLAGHSMGGQVVAEALARHPELSSRGRAHRFRGQPRRAPRGPAGAAHGSGPQRGKPQGAGPGHPPLSEGRPTLVCAQDATLLNHRLEETCPNISAEVLVLGGEKDRVCPRAWLEEITELLPHGRLEEIPGRGHEAVINTPQPAADLILEHARLRPPAQ